MKQTITPEQFGELSEKGKKKLRKWWKPTEGDMTYWSNITGALTKSGEGYWNDLTSPYFDKEEYAPLLSIGQMIQFLYEHNVQITIHNFDAAQISTSPNGHFALSYSNLNSPKPGMTTAQRNELVDLLWIPVKEVLESD